MNIIQQLKRVLAALALMAICSAAILFLPRWSQDEAPTQGTASSSPAKPVPINKTAGGKQA
jgi:hypothetical protein